MAEPFWKTKSLEEMSASEWESLCDGCGKCCLSKLEDEDTGDIYFTSVGCRLFDAGTCRCRDYPNRLAVVQDCVGLTPANVRTIAWLPGTCAYRLVAEGRDLFDWHPLVSGDPDSVHLAGVSMRGRVTASEAEMGEPEDYLEHMLEEEP
ncbi:MAG: YcgN family cysteine cluster protein [Alphaproteobacteria bacterium]|nr:YcgN family cysteine cluster protein [Alphaproteobacteria bacterium]MBU0802951.1 YcgN family cysteine cluster protein [Alphaproteobacteria bacterium]MBU0870938.1 YcgN family cysteine cluster protein [Alphaproteobacteria bacterium]MBU1403391.1 YcgN family cysteine cluster protein [Alphaproteobacteria bacterium]MBU1589727.1 YcgN family cysteine cluster protein [Alphaproteobacteria bacterium]